MRSRAGAKLEYTRNDIRALHKKMPSYGGYVDGNIKHLELLNPSKKEFFHSIDLLVTYLNETSTLPDRKKVFNIIYAGHGQPSDGGWELKDGVVTGEALYKFICNKYQNSENILHLDFIIDSCYSARFLVDIIVASQDNSKVYPFDCVVSSLIDEKSWEMSFLEHGALSFHLVNEGNSYVNSDELAKAVDEENNAYIAKCIQGITIPNPVTFLTKGKQHSVTLTSGFLLEVQGAGSVDLSDYAGELTHSDIANTLEIAKTSYGKRIQYDQD